MRIGIPFHTKDDYLSGVEYYSLGLVRCLAQYIPGNEYVVLTNRPELVESYLGARDNVCVSSSYVGNYRPLRVLWEHLRLPRLAERWGFDVLHCPCYICPAMPSSVPYVVTIHDTLALDYPNWCQHLNALYFRLAMKRTVARADRIVAVSSQTKRDLTRHFCGCSSKCRVISPAIDPIFFARKASHEWKAIRERYGLPAQYVLYVGNIEPKKNVLGLLDAHRLLTASGRPHKHGVVGKRQWRAVAEIRELARGEADGSVVFTGYVAREDLPGVYQMSALYVCASLYEGFGFPPLEAMASGVPVVSSTRGALAETVGDAAYLVDPEDTRQIADAMASVIGDEGIRREYVSRGLSHVRKFDGRRAALQYQALYSELAA